MTLQEVKEKLAHENGNVSWFNYCETWRHAFPEKTIDAVAEEYAKIKWKEACDAQLVSIAKGFSDNLHKADRDSDKDVFKALSETIMNYPKPEFQ